MPAEQLSDGTGVGNGDGICDGTGLGIGVGTVVGTLVGAGGVGAPSLLPRCRSGAEGARGGGGGGGQDVTYSADRLAQLAGQGRGASCLDFDGF